MVVLLGGLFYKRVTPVMASLRSHGGVMDSDGVSQRASSALTTYWSESVFSSR